MSNENQKPIDVKFVTAVVLSHEDIDGVLRHFQLTIVQETETKKFRVYFDVIDPSKIKLQDNEVRESDNA